MKKKFLITGAAISLSALLGVGAVSGILNAKEPVQANATTGSGSFYVKLESVWKTNESSIAFYFFDEGANNAWYQTTLDPTDTTTTYYQFSYSGLSFDPTSVIAVRIYRGSTPGSWCFDENNSGTYSRTNDLTLNDAIWLGAHYENSWYTNAGSFSLATSVIGGASDSWSTQTVNTALTHTKTDGSKIEVYGSVTLPANTYFKVVKTGVSPQEWYGSYTCLKSIEGNLSGGGESNIHNTAAATYDFYFNFDGNTTYITDPVVAAADEWAQDFYKHVGCDPTGVNVPSNWSTFATSYAALDGDVKDLIYAANAVEDGSFVEQAMWQYDWAVAHHSSLTKFVTNSSDVVRAVNTSLAVNHYSLFTADSTTTIALITIVAVTSITAIGAIVFLRVRKHQ